MMYWCNVLMNKTTQDSALSLVVIDSCLGDCVGAFDIPPDCID